MLAHQSQVGKVTQESPGVGSIVSGRKKGAEESPGAGSPELERKRISFFFNM